MKEALRDIINLDIKIHKLARQIDRGLDRCAESHLHGCRCTDELVSVEADLQAEYREATGRRWIEKYNLHKPGMEFAVELWWARHGQNVAGAYGFPAGEVAR